MAEQFIMRILIEMKIANNIEKRGRTMTFILTDREKLTPINEDLTYLSDALYEVSTEINFSWFEMVFDSRVSYSVSPDFSNLDVHVNESAEISINFRKEDLKKHPTKYGLNFRNDCLKTALRFANEMLSENRKFLTITIREDSKAMEKCTYERRNAKEKQ